MSKQKGQIIVTLILVMTVALAIGLSIIQRSLTDVSTSTKVEQSARAFSAAEAGIEKAIQANSDITSPIPLGNEAFIQDVQKNAVPAVPDAGNRQLPLEDLHPLAKDEISQVWLADLYSTSNPPAAFYTQNSLDIFWGRQNIASADDKPAIEIKVIEYSSGVYSTRPFYLDPNSSRVSSNNFTDVSSGCSDTSAGITTTVGVNRKFYCRWTLTGLNPTLMLLRARILYSRDDQPFAVQAVGNRGVGNCPSSPPACWLPLQERIFISTGISGETQRRVQVSRRDKVVPPYFDYAIFSAGEIKK